jgi:hypothetical protein
MGSPGSGIWMNSMINVYRAHVQRRQHDLLRATPQTNTGLRNRAALSEPSPRSAIRNGCWRSDAERIKATLIAHGAGNFLRSQRSEQHRRINSAAERDNQWDIGEAWQQLCQA